MSYLDKLQRFELSGHGSTPRHNDITIEPAVPNARPVFWERADGLMRTKLLARQNVFTRGLSLLSEAHTQHKGDRQ